MYYLCKTAKCHVLAYYATDEWQSTCFSCPRRRIRHGSVSKLFPGYRVCSSVLQHVEMRPSNVIPHVNTITTPPSSPHVQTPSESSSKRSVASMKLEKPGHLLTHANVLTLILRFNIRIDSCNFYQNTSISSINQYKMLSVVSALLYTN